MKYKKHFYSCSAPICASTEDMDAIWRAGEEVCSHSPMTKWQRVQNKINRLVLRGKIEEGRIYTLGQLEKSRLVKN